MTEGTRAGRVLTAVRLLRQGSGDTAMTAGLRRHAEVDWPARLLARCVVLRAHDLGGRRARTAVTEDSPEVVALWQRALEDVLSWDADELRTWLHGARSLHVRCGRTTHALTLDGAALVARHHAEFDVDAERAGLALGGAVDDCTAAVLAWQDGEPDAPTAGRATGPLSILRWLDVVRTWDASGYDPGAAYVAVAAGLRPADLAGHLSAGLSLEQAAQWADWDVSEALRWRALRATPDDAALWVLQNRPLADAEAAVIRLADAGVPADDAVQRLVDWARRAGARADVEVLTGWVASGRPSSHWGELAARRLSYDDVAPWVAAGFGPAELLRYSHLRAGLGDAVAWRAAGVDPVRASALLGVGVTLDEARQLADVPAEDVVALWRAAGSVPALRALLDERLSA